MFIYGTLQDKLYIKRNLLIFASVLATLVGPFFIWIYGPLLDNNFNLGIIMGALFLSAGYLASVGVFEAVSERFSRLFGFEYGQARAWGSFGYALVALLAGFLFVKNPHLNFWAGSFFGSLLLLNLLFWNPKVEREANQNFNQEQAESNSIPSLKEMFDLMKLPQLWTIIIFIVLHGHFIRYSINKCFRDFILVCFQHQLMVKKYMGH